MARVLLAIAPERFRDEELFVTQEELRRRGHVTTIGSTRRGKCPGSRGGSATATVVLSDALAKDYDAIVFVGGGGSRTLFADEDALRLAREGYALGRIVAAICLGPVILANAGVLKGKKATVAGTEAKAIEAKGARYAGPGVTVDGNVVTGNAPKASRLFGQTVADLLENRQETGGQQRVVLPESPVRGGTSRRSL